MAHDDFATEPVRGLPEAPPQGERILWQGAPDPWALAKASLAVRWIAGYFGLMALWRGTVMGLEAGPAGAVAAAATYLGFGALAVLVFALMARAMAKATVYTITTHRVAMRIGAALTVTLNLPYAWIAKADLAPGPGGTGSIHLALKGANKFSYLVLWPHIRPWHMRTPEPTLRAIPDARAVAEILGAAAEARVGEITCELTETPAPAAPAAAPAAASVAAE